MHHLTLELNEALWGFILSLTITTPIYRLLLELDEAFSTLAGDTELLTKFQKAWEDIGVWVSDTKSMLEVSTATSSPRHASRMGGAAPHSSALLRGKQQVQTISVLV